MKKNWQKILAFVAAMGLISFDPESKEKLALSAEDKSKLDKESGVEGFAEKFEATFNEKNVAQEQVELSNDILNEFMASEESPEGGEDPNAEEQSLGEKLQALVSRVGASEKENTKLKATVAKLTGDPETDDPEAVIQTQKGIGAMKHSKTHVFAVNETYAAIEGRNWNKNVLLKSNGEAIAVTDWSDAVNVQKINADFGAYSRKNIEKVIDLFRDGLDIPKHWPVISNVSDEIAYSMLVTGEITQGLKKKWLPKNVQKFLAIKGKVYDVQIDITWTATQLKAIEKTYLNTMFNKEGSSPFKMHFVEFLMERLRQQARKEDKIALIKGVYHDNTDSDTPGLFINRMNGLLKNIDLNKSISFKPFALPKLTTTNVYDVINDAAKLIPYELRVQPGLYLYIAPYWKNAYDERRSQVKGGNSDYKGKIDYVEGYPNIVFDKRAQMEGSDLFFITTEDNISVLMDKPGEENVFTIEKSKRDIDAYADYKLGSHVSAFGVKPDSGAPKTFENQIFFCNDVEILTDTYIPVAANATALPLANHNALLVGEFNTSATDVTGFSDAVVGQRIYLKGNADTNKSTIKHNANILLDGGADMVLENGDLLVLQALAGGKFIELYRKLATDTDVLPELTLVDGATTADAIAHNVFVTSDNTGATAITTIENAVDGEEYTIKGGSDTNSTTIANSGEFRLTAAMTLGAGAFITVLYINGDFVEVARG